MISPSRSYKERVQEAFSKGATTYDSAAGLQFLAARITAKLIEENAHLIPEGPILEVGCGTGMLSSFLPAIFPDRQIIFSDISAEMIQHCRTRVISEKSKSKKKDAGQGQFEFRVLDAEELKTHSEYAAIVSSFAIQWFYQPFKGITRLLSALKPEGILFFSVPGDASCPQWRAAAEKLEVPFTRNPLPSYEELKDFADKMGFDFDLEQRVAEESYPDAKSMLHSLRILGANTQKSDVRLNYTQLRKLMKELDGGDDGVALSYQVITGYYRRI